jgi:hypothetical protein
VLTAGSIQRGLSGSKALTNSGTGLAEGSCSLRAYTPAALQTMEDTTITLVGISLTLRWLWAINVEFGVALSLPIVRYVP